MGRSRSLSKDRARHRSPDFSHSTSRSGLNHLYRESSIVKKRSREKLTKFYEEHNITLKGTDIPKPILNFNEINLPASVLTVIEKNKWKKPTPIQCQGWPMALSGRDVVGIAQTGSGKTAAFVVPALIHVQSQPPSRAGDGPICLILLPTRELAQQVNEVAMDFCSVMHYRTACIYGGQPHEKQRYALRQHPELVIATPGRLTDFLQAGATNLRRCSFLVLDEADRMLDMGFEPQIRKILDQIPSNRQTLMWSATWPKEVQKLAQDFLKEYIQVSVGTLQLRANANITQHIQVISETDKEKALLELLRSFDRRDRVLVFTETKIRADKLTHYLNSVGFRVSVMHGNKSQKEREKVLEAFRDGYSPILIATDVASRGLDIDDIKFVVNYDFPALTEDYIHRIGRTGRRDRTGTAYTFFTVKNANKAQELVKVLQESSQMVPQELVALTNHRFAGNNGRRGWGGRNNNGTMMNMRTNGFGGFQGGGAANNNRLAANPRRNEVEQHRERDQRRPTRRSRSLTPRKRKRSRSRSSLSRSRSSSGRRRKRGRRSRSRSSLSRSRSSSSPRKHKRSHKHRSKDKKHKSKKSRSRSSPRRHKKDKRHKDHKRQRDRDHRRHHSRDNSASSGSKRGRGRDSRESDGHRNKNGYSREKGDFGRDDHARR